MKVVTRKRLEETAAESSNPDNRGLDEAEYNVYHIHKSRRALVEHAKSQPQSRKDDHNTGRYAGNRQSSPPTKRLRRERENTESEGERSDKYGGNDNCQQDKREKRRRLNRSDRFISSDGLRNKDGERTRSSELLSVVRHGNETDGRLSYWDNEYSRSDHRDKCPSVDEPFFDLWENSSIECMDPVWEQEMATFDVDEFLEGLNEHLVAYEQARSSRVMKAPMMLGRSKFQGGPSNTISRIGDTSDEPSESREVKGDSQATSRGLDGNLGPTFEKESNDDRAYSGQITDVPVAVRAARVAPLYTGKRRDFGVIPPTRANRSRSDM